MQVCIDLSLINYRTLTFSIFWTNYNRNEITKRSKGHLERKCSKIPNSPSLITEGVASKPSVHSITIVDEVAEPTTVFLSCFHGFYRGSAAKKRPLGQRQRVTACLCSGILVKGSIYGYALGY